MWGFMENCKNIRKMSFKGLEKRPRNIFYNLLLWDLACLPLYIGRIPVNCQCVSDVYRHECLLFSRRFSRKCLEVISFKFFVCFIFNVSLGSAPKRKNFDIQRNTRVGSGGQFTSNRLSCHPIDYGCNHCVTIWRNEEMMPPLLSKLDPCWK